MRSNWSASEVPANSGRPLAISAKMHPTDQMSTGVEYLRLPIRTSGARYHRVTTFSKNRWKGCGWKKKKRERERKKKHTF